MTTTTTTTMTTTTMTTTIPPTERDDRRARGTSLAMARAPPSVPEVFRDGTALVTGGTGFLGKILVEKLLRSCPVRRVAVLVRGKRGVGAEQRIADVYKQSLFDQLRAEKPDFADSIRVIDGDLDNSSSLGLSPEHRRWVIENVNFVFHCAATVKFNEPLELATKINVKGTENLLSLAAEMKNLKGFVHVSTAYSHYPRNEIKEQYYYVPVTAKELENSLSSKSSSPSEILGDWPNTYTFTKAVTENMVSENANSLPISVFRPSIVACTYFEPEPGWLDTLNGLSGMTAWVITGFVRTFFVRRNGITDIVPADYTVNALISVMWDTVNRYEGSDQRTEEPKIYNYVSSTESPLTWGEYINELRVHNYENPPLQAIWYPMYVLSSNLWVGTVLRFFLHRVPAVCMDCLLIVSGKSPKMLKMYTKAECGINMLYMFVIKEWQFDNTNTQKLWLSLSQEDRETFQFSLNSFAWKPYMKHYYNGIRKYLLHEDPDNIAKAQAKHQKLFWLHQLSIVLIIYFAFQLCWKVISLF